MSHYFLSRAQDIRALTKRAFRSELAPVAGRMGSRIRLVALTFSRHFTLLLLLPDTGFPCLEIADDRVAVTAAGSDQVRRFLHDDKHQIVIIDKIMGFNGLNQTDKGFIPVRLGHVFINQKTVEADTAFLLVLRLVRAVHVPEILDGTGHGLDIFSTHAAEALKKFLRLRTGLEGREPEKDMPVGLLKAGAVFKLILVMQGAGDSRDTGRLDQRAPAGDSRLFVEYRAPVIRPALLRGLGDGRRMGKSSHGRQSFQIVLIV